MRAPDTVLHAAGVCVSLGGMPVLREVGITLRPGTMVALLGGNGSGKTTFVRALLGLTPMTRGDATWFGTPLTEFRQWSRIGYTPQRGVLQSTQSTVFELVASGMLPQRHPFQPLGRTGRQAVAAALDRVELTDRAKWPLSKLSGGQLQRALIARALVGEAEALVFDEPMAGIDLRTQERLARLFAGFKRSGLAMLLVLHELGPLTDLIDDTVVLEDGRVVPSNPTSHDYHEEPCKPAPLGLDDPWREAL